MQRETKQEGVKPKGFTIMSILSISRLVLSWSVSKGRDTYGYNICRLDDIKTGKRYRTIGGGYDMVGTVLADWLTDYHQDRLQAFVKNYLWRECNYSVKGYFKIDDFYGLEIKPNGVVSIDGACGLDSVRRVIEALGFEFESVYNKRKQATEAFYITETIA